MIAGGREFHAEGMAGANDPRPKSKGGSVGAVE